MRNLCIQPIKTSKDQSFPIKWSIIYRWPTHPGLIGNA
ncbi:ferrochelatase [Puccinia sorghi]|uniref:Ferrochelatase n=1 Tax=Puccinia sorghi TaxID=27349 RepID=A0A0L6V2E9_9BASI|nr:ferrochelatase [Puccinia sorghi]